MPIAVFLGCVVPDPFDFPLLVLPFHAALGDDIANAYYASVCFGVLRKTT